MHQARPKEDSVNKINPLFLIPTGTGEMATSPKMVFVTSLFRKI